MDTPTVRQETPNWVTRLVTTLGGLNPLRKPNYRVVWGGNRTHLVGGRFKVVSYVDRGGIPIIGQPQQMVGIVTEVTEMRTLLKYHPMRWHLEKWLPASAYGTRDNWYLDTWDEDCQLHTQGDYPAEGEYEHVFYLAQCSHMQPGDEEWCWQCKLTSGEFIPLEENFHLIERQIYALRLSAEVNAPAEKSALFKRESDRREASNKIVAARVQNAMRPVMATQPTSWQPGTGGKCSVPEPKINWVAYAPNRTLGLSQMPVREPLQLPKSKLIEEK